MPCFSSHLIHCSVFKVQLSSTQTPYHSQQRSRYFSLISLCLLFDSQTLALVCESSQNLTILIFLRPDANVQFLERFHLFSKAFQLLLSGGDSRDRTGDLLLARQALSQLSYIPDSLRKVVGPSGLEPPTLRLSVVRSSQLSYGPIQHSRACAL